MLKPHPWWLFFIPSYFWITLKPNIYHPKGTDPLQFPAVVAHETVHLSQQSEGNLFMWYLKYAFSRKFRLQMEAKAIAVEIKFYQNLYPWDVDPVTNFAERNLQSYADALSSWNYFWAASSKEKAAEAIKKCMSELA